jgi:ATP-binding protein involved in chromosome partitioning
MGFLVDADAPMVWRGPVASGALRQMLQDVNWAPLDILVIDMPPGTGDIQLSLAQSVPLAGAVIVSTPQEVALADVRRGIAMFEKTHVPVLGVVENMAYFEAPGGQRIAIFGEGGARRTAEAFGVPFLGEVPIDVGLRESGDAGRPLVATAPDAPLVQTFRAIAEATLARLAEGQKQPPKITFE